MNEIQRTAPPALPDLRLIQGALALADEEVALTELFEDVLSDWATSLRRPMSVEAREAVEAAYLILASFDPERMACAREDLAPSLGVVA